MSKTFTGWTVFIAALGMMSGLMALDISRLQEWSELGTPSFVGNMLVHFGTVVTAFLGGKLIPENREGKYTRAEDSDGTR